MKNYVFYTVIFLFQLTVWGQMLPSHLEVQMKIKDNAGSKILIPEYSGPGEAGIEGYIYTTDYNNFPEGIFEKGGFNFLNENIFGGMIRTFSHKWIRNGFIPGPVEMMSTGMNIKTAISFMILPQQVNSSGDSLYLLLKLARYDLKNRNGSELDCNYNVRLYYYLILVPLNMDIKFPQITECFPGQDILFRISPITMSAAQVFNNTPPEYESLLKKSILESDSLGLSIGCDVQFFSSSYAVPVLSSYSYPEDYLMKINKEFTLNKNISKYLFPGMNTSNIKSPYFAHLQFPFRIYDKADFLKYESYKSKDIVFQQNYDIILNPISYSGDTLIADLFLSYQKVSGSSIQRWTPIKKRLKLCINLPSRIDLPKENWSMSAMLHGEKFDLYGYSDYDRFVHEYLVITLNSITHEGK